jgi:hypothetical protein
MIFLLLSLASHFQKITPKIARKRITKARLCDKKKKLRLKILFLSGGKTNFEARNFHIFQIKNGKFCENFSPNFSSSAFIILVF